MSSEDRVKLLLAPTIGPLRALLDRLRALPWPAPLQRVTRRGLERLSARIPELRDLLGKKPGDTAAAAPRTVQSTAAPSALSDLLKQLTARDYPTRATAAQALAHHPEPQAVEALIGALRDRSVEVAVSAATALGMSGGERARTALREVLANAEGYYHALARAAAVHGLGVLLAAGERAPLHRALRDLDAEVSIAAIAALSATGESESAEALLRVVENADNYFLPITRLAAARGLERLPSVGESELAPLLARESDALVRETLERLLARARTSAGVEA